VRWSPPRHYPISIQKWVEATARPPGLQKIGPLKATVAIALLRRRGPNQRDRSRESVPRARREDLPYPEADYDFSLRKAASLCSRRAGSCRCRLDRRSRWASVRR
jgi:hypothetical protein